ncbi:hypothetical protein MTO96_051223 [Rhipicephalus appendiculatus]
MCDYRGVQKVCYRCRLAGHIGKDCATPRCTRCNVFGHATEGCIEPCRRCSGNHATADCIRPKSFAAAAAGEQGGAEFTPPTRALQEEQAPARESDSETVTSDVCSQAESEELEDRLPPSEKASSDLHTRNDTADSSSETPDDHDTSKPAAPASFPSGDHTGSSADPGGSTDGSDAPRSSTGRGTRAAGRPEAMISRPDLTQPTATSSRVSKFSAHARKMNLSNPLHKITGPVAGASAGDCPMNIERQAAKRVHPSSTDSEGSEGGVSKPHKLPHALTQSEQISP